MSRFPDYPDSSDPRNPENEDDSPCPHDDAAYKCQCCGATVCGDCDAVATAPSNVPANMQPAKGTKTCFPCYDDGRRTCIEGCPVEGDPELGGRCARCACATAGGEA